MPMYLDMRSFLCVLFLPARNLGDLTGYPHRKGLMTRNDDPPFQARVLELIVLAPVRADPAFPLKP
jgi:hypothetical protein